MPRTAVGIDIGGTYTKLALVREPGSILDRHRMRSDFDTPENMTAAIAGAAEPWLGDEGDVATAIGVAVPGLVERSSGTVLRAPNLPVLDRFAIGTALRLTTSMPVTLDNDAHAAAVAEARVGAAVDLESAVCLTIGTGVGGAIILGGRVWRGPGGLAGEVGRLVLDPEGRAFFEQEVAAAAIVSAYRRLAGSAATDLTAADLTAAEIARRADDGDEAARQALAACGRRLGVGLAILVNLLNPQRIVIGGGVAGAGEWLLGPARRETERRAWVDGWKECEVVRSRLGADAGALGAALLCWSG